MNNLYITGTRFCVQLPTQLCIILSTLQCMCVRVCVCVCAYIYMYINISIYLQSPTAVNYERVTSMLAMDSAAPEVWSLFMNLCKLLEPIKAAVSDPDEGIACDNDDTSRGKSMVATFNGNGRDKAELTTANTGRDPDTETVSDADVTTGSDVDVPADSD